MIHPLKFCPKLNRISCQHQSNVVTCHILIKKLLLFFFLKNGGGRSHPLATCGWLTSPIWPLWVVVLFRVANHPIVGWGWSMVQATIFTKKLLSSTNMFAVLEYPDGNQQETNIQNKVAL
jgi:hypothetical protein